METFLQQLLAGVATGCIYALIALALVMIYQAIDHINFAQGEMAMFSTYIAWTMLAVGLPWPLAFLATVVVSFFGGVAIERIFLHPLKDAPVLSHIVIFIALYSLFYSVAGAIWGFDIRLYPMPFGSAPLLGNGLFSVHQAVMVGVTLMTLAALTVFFQSTRIGLAMRAAASNPVSARLVGIRVAWMTALGWGMAAAIGAVAGILIAPVVFLEPNMMGGILLYGMAAAVVGGLTSPVGAVIGGIFVGIIENMAGTYIPVIGAELKLPIALFLIIAVLMVRPNGLFGHHVVARV
jgi:branched-chain amino acid transport system permease protein